MIMNWIVIWFLISSLVSGASIQDAGSRNCASGVRTFDPLIHKKTYYIGVHAPAGIDRAWEDYNVTFEEYLTATAGQKFVPPIEFKMKTTTTPLQDWVDREREVGVDFVYSDTGVYSCVGVEIGLQPLATTVSHVKVRGHEYDLDLFGGVIFTREDNEDINSMDDLKDKVIGALDISDFAGAQVQFYAMQKEGQNYIMDPKQVIFTDNQVEIVNGVLNGHWDVGFVRTGQIERTTDENGKLLDAELFKVIAPKAYILDDGNMFPFLHSTPIFPEWPFAATTEVPRDVVEEVQDALIKLEQHKIVAEKVREYKNGGLCEDTIKVEEADAVTTLNRCDAAPPEFFYPTARCDTTRDKAELAYKAAIAGHHNGFRPPRSYFELRSMQEAGGFIMKDEKENWKCTRAETLYDGIACPSGHYKLSRRDFDNACKRIGLPCPVGYTCYCKPCVKAYEMDVYEWGNVYDGELNSSSASINGCDKMSVCGTVQQTKTVTFRAKDNQERKGANVTAEFYSEQTPHVLSVTKVANESSMYEFNFTEEYTGTGILQVYVDGEQIPESPFRVQVIARDCETDFPGEHKTPTSDGHCECGSGTIHMAGKCMDATILAIIITVLVLAIATEIGIVYLRYKRRKNDEMWHVNVEELHFDEPVETIGQGSFGVVLLAEYRGTKVAIKRAIPPGRKTNVSKDSKGSQSDGAAALGSKRDGPGLVDIEAPAGSTDFNNPSPHSEVDFSFLGENGMFRADDSRRYKWGGNNKRRLKQGIIGSKSVSTSRTTLSEILCPWWNEKSRQKEAFLEEMRLLSRLRHPCITTVMGAVVSHGHDPMLVMEYMEYGSLYDLIHSETMFFSGELLLQMTRDIAQGLRYLHASKPPILHGDLKSKNILVDSRFRAKVCDFGLSTKKKNGISGTPFWLAPEYLRGRSDYNTRCDMYSVGIIFYELYSRQDPYSGENYGDVMRGVCDPRRNYRPIIPDSCPPKMNALMKKLWSPDPLFRPQAQDLDAALLDMHARDADPLAKKKDKGIGLKRGKDMLHELFPRHIADALQNGQKVEPEQHEEVTVIFADIVCFEEIARMSEPMKVTGMLDRIFTVLDTLAKKHDLFKVETVGECYMAVANLEGNQDYTHVRNVAKFAKDAMDATGGILIDEDDPKRGCARLRIGLHTGPVVSNVIGSLNPRYGLFGDTVNTASRMGSTSLPNRIHCSEKSALTLREQDPEISLIKRGKIDVKGKGQMTTYWIGDPSPPLVDIRQPKAA